MLTTLLHYSKVSSESSDNTWTETLDNTPTESIRIKIAHEICILDFYNGGKALLE